MTYREWKRMSYLKRAAYLPLVAVDAAWAKLTRERTSQDRYARSYDLSWFGLVAARVPAGRPIYAEPWGRLIAARV